MVCKFNVLLTFSEYPVFSKINLKSSIHGDNKPFKFEHKKLEFLPDTYRRPHHDVQVEVELDHNEDIYFVVPYVIFFRSFEEIEHEFERGVMIPGVPYICSPKASLGELHSRDENIIKLVDTSAFVLVQEKLLDNTFVFTSLTFATVFMYLLYVTFSFATLIK